MITEEMLVQLRQSISLRLSTHRYNHTIGVEKIARFLAENCLPEKKKEISVAAILHDVTKELPFDANLKILREAGVVLENEDDYTPSVIHSFTASVFVKTHFKEFATEEILSAISKHTVGGVDMSVFDKIIFLADFIEENRTYTDAVSTRKFVLDSIKHESVSENVKILDQACVMEIDSTIAHLKSLGKPINKKVFLVKDSLLSKK